MKTVFVNIPDNKENMFLDFFKKHHMKIHVLKREEDEELIAKWIDEGMKSGDVSENEIFETLKRNGVKV